LDGLLVTHSGEVGILISNVVEHSGTWALSNDILGYNAGGGIYIFGGGGPVQIGENMVLYNNGVAGIILQFAKTVTIRNTSVFFTTPDPTTGLDGDGIDVSPRMSRFSVRASATTPAPV
jgi:hypothetical protein